MSFDRTRFLDVFAEDATTPTRVAIDGPVVGHARLRELLGLPLITPTLATEPAVHYANMVIVSDADAQARGKLKNTHANLILYGGCAAHCYFGNVLVVPASRMPHGEYMLPLQAAAQTHAASAPISDTVSPVPPQRPGSRVWPMQ